MTSNIFFFILLGGIIRLFYLVMQAKRKSITGELLLVCIISVFTGLLQMVSNNDYNIFSFINVCLGSTLLLSIIFFAKYVLPKINEIQILIWVMLYWYARLSLGSEIIDFQYIDVAIANLILILCTLATFIISILHVQLSNRLRLLLYIWFMAISTSVLFFALPDFSQIISTDTTTETYIMTHNFKTYLLLMLYGSHIFYIVYYLLYLFFLIPIPGRNQSMKERMSSHREFTKLLSNKFDSYQFKSSTVLACACVVAILLYINFNYGLLSISNTILLTLTAGALVHRWS